MGDSGHLAEELEKLRKTFQQNIYTSLDIEQALKSYGTAKPQQDDEEDISVGLH